MEEEAAVEGAAVVVEAVVVEEAAVVEAAVVEAAVVEAAVVEAAVVSRPILAVRFPRNLRKMSSHRLRSLQNQASQPIPAISTCIAALIHLKNSDFSFYSGQAFSRSTP